MNSTGPVGSGLADLDPAGPAGGPEADGGGCSRPGRLDDPAELATSTARDRRGRRGGLRPRHGWRGHVGRRRRGWLRGSGGRPAPDPAAARLARDPPRMTRAAAATAAARQRRRAVPAPAAAPKVGRRVPAAAGPGGPGAEPLPVPRRWAPLQPSSQPVPRGAVDRRLASKCNIASGAGPDRWLEPGYGAPPRRASGRDPVGRAGANRRSRAARDRLGGACRGSELARSAGRTGRWGRADGAAVGRIVAGRHDPGVGTGGGTASWAAALAGPAAEFAAIAAHAMAGAVSAGGVASASTTRTYGMFRVDGPGRARRPACWAASFAHGFQGAVIRLNRTHGCLLTADRHSHTSG